MKPLKIGAIILLLLNLTGCWSKVEMNELTFVYGLFIDVGKEPGTVEITINSPLPNRLSSGGQPGGSSGSGGIYSTVSKTANTITEAVHLIQQDLTRQLSLAQLKVVVLGEAYAKQGISELLEWIKKEPSLPLATYIMASPGSAKEMTKLTPTYEQLPAEVLRKFASERHMFTTTIKDCLIAEASKMGFAMNYLSFGRKEEPSEEGKSEYWAGIQGAMLFQEDKMKGILKNPEGSALAWAAGNLNFVSYYVTWDEGKSAANVIFVSAKVSKAVTLTNSAPVFTVKLKGKASITYLKDSQNRDEASLSIIILDKLKEKVNADLTGAIRSSQEVGADVLQLGLLLEWNDPKRWEQLKDRWEDYYRDEADIKVTTDFRILDFGTGK